MRLPESYLFAMKIVESYAGQRLKGNALDLEDKRLDMLKEITLLKGGYCG